MNSKQKTVKYIVFKFIKFYQILISPVLGRHCRFEPSCSEYCYLAIERYGAWKGLGRGIKRITRCHPWNKGGLDLP